MTEQEWLTCADPQKMLRFLRVKGSERKLRLFAVACCYSVVGFIRRLFPHHRTIITDDEKAWNAIRVAEQFADNGMPTFKDLQMAYHLADKSFQNHGELEYAFRSTAYDSAGGAAHETLKYLDRFLGDELALDDNEYPKREAPLLRCIFGNPFRPVTISANWLTPTVLSLAQSIYDERAFDRMPILADALEEAGCDNAHVLTHCRQQAEHVRGCWVVDLVLGKK